MVQTLDHDGQHRLYRWEKRGAQFPDTLELPCMDVSLPSTCQSFFSFLLGGFLLKEVRTWSHFAPRTATQQLPQVRCFFSCKAKPKLECSPSCPNSSDFSDFCNFSRWEKESKVWIALFLGIKMTAISTGLLFYIITYVNRSMHMSVCLGYMGDTEFKWQSNTYIFLTFFHLFTIKLSCIIGGWAVRGTLW